jgi:hypothetical protein
MHSINGLGTKNETALCSRLDAIKMSSSQPSSGAEFKIEVIEHG